MQDIDVNVFNGEQCRPMWLMNWCNSNVQHIDYHDKNTIVSAYTTYGSLTGIGNVVPFAMAVADTDYFRNSTFKNNNFTSLMSLAKSNSLAHGITISYSIILQYCSLDENLDDLLKTFIKISPKQLRINQRGSVVTFSDLAMKNQTSQSYLNDICQIVRSIRQHYTP
jgi:hypothetical protein